MSTPAGGQYPNDGTAEPVSFVREAGSRSAREQMLAQSLPASPPAEGDTRMMEQQNLSASHASLKVSLSVSKCSPIFCPMHLLRKAHPNDRTVESVGSSHGAAPDW